MNDGSAQARGMNMLQDSQPWGPGRASNRGEGKPLLLRTISRFLSQCNTWVYFHHKTCTGLGHSPGETWLGAYVRKSTLPHIHEALGSIPASGNKKALLRDIIRTPETDSVPSDSLGGGPGQARPRQTALGLGSLPPRLRAWRTLAPGYLPPAARPPACDSVTHSTPHRIHHRGLSHTSTH